MRDLEHFCHNVKALETFYKEVLERSNLLNIYSELSPDKMANEVFYDPSILSLVLPTETLAEDTSSTHSLHDRTFDSLESSEVWISLDNDTQNPNKI